VKRRSFITLLGGAAAAWPLAARAQQSRKRIGFLGTSSLSLERHLLDAFVQSLRELGHVDGENIAIEYRWAEGQDNRLPNLAAELVGLGPDVIVTTGTPSTIAAKQATSTIPIVFASSGSPITAGLVASLARPGGNVTGFTLAGAELEGKRVQLLKEAVPGLSRLAVVWNPANPPVFEFYQWTKAAAALGLTLQPVVEVRQTDDFKDAFSTIIGAKPDAMTVLPDRFLLAHRNEVVSFAANNQLPAVYPYRAYVVAGGLMSYAPNDIDQFRRTAVYVDKVLKGAKPADLPVQEPIKFELVINLKTGTTLGLTIPPGVLAIADEVIE
jgi:putative tryptophan/tyrosine transport system substrate-binding protein